MEQEVNESEPISGDRLFDRRDQSHTNPQAKKDRRRGQVPFGTRLYRRTYQSI